VEIKMLILIKLVKMLKNSKKFWKRINF